MSEAKFTKGEWKSEITEYGDLVVRLNPAENKGYCETLYFGDMENTESEDHFNAYLIAAAPELYKTLQEIIEQVASSRTVSIGSLHNTYEVQVGREQVQCWQAVLDKARGEKQTNG